MSFLRRVFGSTPAPTPKRLDHRAVTLPAGYRRLAEGPSMEVHGETHHRAAIDAAVGPLAEGDRAIFDAVLVREPDHPVDPNAIAVLINAYKCGYLPKLAAKQYAPVMAWSTSEGFVPVVRADVTGGYRRSENDLLTDHEILIYVASPDEILGRKPPPAVIPPGEHPWAGQVIAFTGDSRYALNGEKLHRESSVELARGAGIEVHPRVSKKVQLLVDCDERGVSGNQANAIKYGIPVIPEGDFWRALRLPVERIDEAD